MTKPASIEHSPETKQRISLSSHPDSGITVSIRPSTMPTVLDRTKDFFAQYGPLLLLLTGLLLLSIFFSLLLLGMPVVAAQPWRNRASTELDNLQPAQSTLASTHPVSLTHTATLFFPGQPLCALTDSATLAEQSSDSTCAIDEATVLASSEPQQRLTDNKGGIKLNMTEDVERTILASKKHMSAFLLTKQYINEVVTFILQGKSSIPANLFKMLLAQGLQIHFEDLGSASARANFEDPLVVKMSFNPNNMLSITFDNIKASLHNELHHVLVHLANKNCADKDSVIPDICSAPVMDQSGRLDFPLVQTLQNSVLQVDAHVKSMIQVFVRTKASELMQPFNDNEQQLLIKLITAAKGHFDPYGENTYSNEDNDILSTIIANKPHALYLIAHYARLIYQSYEDNSTSLHDVQIDINHAVDLVESMYKPRKYTITCTVQAFEEAWASYHKKTGIAFDLTKISDAQPIIIPNDVLAALIPQEKQTPVDAPSMIAVPYYLVGHAIDGSKMTLSFQGNKGAEGFFHDFSGVKKGYYSGGYYFEKYSAMIPNNVSENEKNLILGAFMLMERASDVQMFLAEKEMAKLLAPLFNTHFRSYYKRHGLLEKAKMLTSTPSALFTASDRPSAEATITEQEQQLVL